MKLQSIFRKRDTIPSCSVVIVAAGSSARMGMDKIMASLGGLPVLVRTLIPFEKSEYVDEIIIVTRMEKITAVADLCKKYNISKVRMVVCGGNTRMESALAGVSELRHGAKLIAIHDGARPLVTEAVIKRTVLSAAKHASAVPVIKSVDTLKAVDDKGFVVGTVDRETTMRVQTPQVFDADIIKGALTKAVTNKLSITDDCAAVEMMGFKVMTVEGDECNIKLTTPADMKIAESIMRARGDYYEDWTRL